MSTNVAEIQFETPFHAGQLECWDGFIGDDAVIECSINAARRWGKTLFAMRCALYWMINNPGCTVGFLAPETNNFVGVYRWFQNQLGHVIEKASSLPNYIIKFKGSDGQPGSTLLFYSMKNHQAVRGQGFDYAIADEFGHGLFSDQDCVDSYGATLAQAKKILYISTPVGMNLHYKKHQQCLYNSNKFAYAAKTRDNPYIPIEFIEEKRAELPLFRFQQEYEGMFIDGAGTVFGNFAPNCTISDYVSTYAEPVFIGVDIALGGEDMTTVTIMNQEGHVINREEWREGNTSSQIMRIKLICSQYDVKRGFIEINTERGIQQAVAVDYPQVDAWTTTRKNKPKMIQNLKKDINDQIVQLPTQTLDPVLYGEFAGFQATANPDGYIKYGHQVGGHDDSVISTALANEARVPNRYAGGVDYHVAGSHVNEWGETELRTNNIW